MRRSRAIAREGRRSQHSVDPLLVTASKIDAQRDLRSVLEAAAEPDVADYEISAVAWEGLSSTEVGAIVGVDPTTVRTRLHRIRQRLETARVRSPQNTRREPVMDVLDEFRRLRPEAATFDQRDAEQLWADTFGSDASADPEPSEPSSDGTWTPMLEPVTALDGGIGRQHDGRRMLVWLGSAAAVMALIVGVLVVAGRPSTSVTGVSEPGSTAADDPSNADGSLVSEWATFPTMPIEPRFQYSAVSTGTGIFVWGGCCANGSSSEVFTDGAYFDGTTQTWEPLPDTPLDPTRGDAVAGWNGSEVVVINGIDGVTAAAFDPVSFTWRSITAPDAQTATNGGSRLHLFDDGRLGFVWRMSVSYWNPTADTWSPPVRDDSFNIDWEESDIGSVVGTYTSTPTSVATITIGSGDNCSTARIRTFDSTTQTWSATALPSQDSYPTDIVGIDAGRFLLSGAAACDPTTPPPAQQSATIFDPADGSFTPVADLAYTDVSSRYGGIWNGDVAMWLLENGRLLAYRPATNEWLLGQSLLDASANSGDLISDTPIVWFDNHVVVASPGWGRSRQSSDQPRSAGAAVTPPKSPGRQHRR